MNQAYWNMLVDAIFFTLGKEYLISSGASFPPCSGANCDEAPSGPCDNYEVYYAQPECRAYCVKIGPVLPVGYRNTSVTPMSCDSETNYACCEYRKYFCMCGGELHVTNVATYTMGNCDISTEQENLQRADCKSRTTDDRDQLFYIPCSNNCTD